MNDEEAGQLISYLQCSGLNPTAAQMANPGMTRTIYAMAFTAAGVELDEAFGAAAAYAAEPDPGTFPKPFPDPGTLLARTGAAKRAKAIEDGAKSAAQRCFYAVVQARSSYGGGYYGPIVNILGFEGNHALEAQIQAGVQAIGGWRAMGMFEEKDLQWREKDFVAAFLAERAIVKADKALTAAPLRAITGGK